LLSIKKRHRLSAPLTAGMIAFTVGLTGTVAYLNATTPYDDLTFNKQQNSDKTSKPEASQSSGSSDSAASGSDNTGTTTTADSQTIPVAEWAPVTPQTSTAPPTPQTTLPVVEQPEPEVIPPSDEAPDEEDDPTALIDRIIRILPLP